MRKHARGFPCFYRSNRLSRVITGDIWSFLRHIVDKDVQEKEARAKALSYIDQAFDFYAAAANPRQSSRPLLYYYAFMNLAKVAVLHSNVDLPPKLKHGISDPQANARQRLHLKTQVVRAHGSARDHSEFFPEFVRALPGGSQVDLPSDFKVLLLMGQVPAIHRTYCMAGSKDSSLKVPAFCPVSSIAVRRDRTHIWAVLTVRRHDRDTELTRPSIAREQVFCRAFHQILPPDKHSCTIVSCCYESKAVPFSRRGIETAIGKLADTVRECGVWTILTPDGYCHYLNRSSRSEWLPQLCSTYAIMFYLGSIVRYKPYDFGKIVKGYSWVINEFLDTQPVQFLHLLASHLAGTEVVMPRATRVAQSV